jgi:hypothetical protein
MRIFADLAVFGVSLKRQYSQISVTIRQLRPLLLTLCALGGKQLFDIGLPANTVLLGFMPYFNYFTAIYDFGTRAYSLARGGGLSLKVHANSAVPHHKTRSSLHYERKLHNHHHTTLK